MTTSDLPGTWHADPEALRDWVTGSAGPLAGASVEQHLARCASCRAAIADLVPVAPLETVWDGILETVEVPPLGAVERLLLRLGLAPSDALVITTAATLRPAWTAAVIAVLGFTLLATMAGPDASVALFLMAAPLIPVAGVAVVYGPAADPSYEAVMAAPYSLLRLVLLRTATVVVTSVPLAVLTGLVLPTSTWTAVAWLLPAAGFTAAVLTADRWVEAEHAAVVIALAWVAAVALAARGGDPLQVIAPAAMFGYAALLVAAGLVLLRRLLSAGVSWRLR